MSVEPEERRAILQMVLDYHTRVAAMPQATAPPSVATVLDTAKKFEQYISTGEVPISTSGRK